MALPWLGALKAKYDRVKAFVRAQEAANTTSWEYIDRAPGWTVLDCHYTLIPPPGYELAPGVVSFIKSFCPDYIPTWEVKTYNPPYDSEQTSPETFIRHCIARHVTDAKIPLHVFPKMRAPFGATRPNYLEQVITAGDDPRASDLPGLYAPLDMAKAEQLRRVYDKYKNLKPSDYAEQSVLVPFNASAFELAKKQEARREAERYVTKSLDKYLKTVSDSEVINFICKEEDEIKKAYSFMKSGKLPSPLDNLAADPMKGTGVPSKEIV